MSRPHLADIQRLASTLNDRAEQACLALLPRGHREGHLWVEARRSQGGLGDSLKVELQGARKGKWRHYGDGTFGDMLDLVMLVQRCDKAEAHDWARRFVGGDVVPPVPAAEREAQQRREDAARVERLRKARGGARALWLEGAPITAEDPAGRYLDARLGGHLRRLLDLDYGLHALRFHPAVAHPDTEGRFPAMLAQAIFANGDVATVHRTYLRELPGGRVDRLRPERDGLVGKALFCAIDGGVIPLWRGSELRPKTGEIARGRPYTQPVPPDAEQAGASITLCEGIEKGLAIALALPDTRVASVSSLPNLRRIDLPRAYTRITWAGDHLPEVGPAMRDRLTAARLAGDSLAEREAIEAIRRVERLHESEAMSLDRLLDQGRDVLVARPPPDWSDYDAGLISAA